MWSVPFPRKIRINSAKLFVPLPTACRITVNQAICLLVQRMKPERLQVLISQINFLRILPAIVTPARLSPCHLLPFKNALFPKAILLWWKYSLPICHRSDTGGGSGSGLDRVGALLTNRTNADSPSVGYTRLEHLICSPVLVVDRINAFVRTLFPSRPVPLSALQEQQVTPYPQLAIRELLMNAVMHRDYQSNAPIRFYQFSDRIEIQNPGGLYGAAADFPRQNDYRNPKIAEAMKNLAYVNQFGRGIATVQAALHTNGNQPAEFDIGQVTFFLVKVLEANP